MLARMEFYLLQSTSGLNSEGFNKRMINKGQ